MLFITKEKKESKKNRFHGTVSASFPKEYIALCHNIVQHEPGYSPIILVITHTRTKCTQKDIHSECYGYTWGDWALNAWHTVFGKYSWIIISTFHFTWSVNVWVWYCFFCFFVFKYKKEIKYKKLVIILWSCARVVVAITTQKLSISPVFDYVVLQSSGSQRLGTSRGTWEFQGGAR